MALKQFFVTISSREDLKGKIYVDGQTNEKYKKATCFASIPMLDKNINEEDEVEIIPIRIEDKNRRSRTNMKKFLDEIDDLFKEKNISYTRCVDYQKDENGNAVLEEGRPIIENLEPTQKEKVVICSEISVPHEETREKQIAMYKEITKRFKERAMVFADITYGSKAMPVCIISSLLYADSLCLCDVRKVIYGQYTYDDSDKATVFDVRSLFEIGSLMATINNMSREDADVLLKNIWE